MSVGISPEGQVPQKSTEVNSPAAPAYPVSDELGSTLGPRNIQGEVIKGVNVREQISDAGKVGSDGQVIENAIKIEGISSGAGQVMSTTPETISTPTDGIVQPAAETMAVEQQVDSGAVRDEAALNVIPTVPVVEKRTFWQKLFGRQPKSIASTPAASTLGEVKNIQEQLKVDARSTEALVSISPAVEVSQQATGVIGSTSAQESNLESENIPKKTIIELEAEKAPATSDLNVVAPVEIQTEKPAEVNRAVKEPEIAGGGIDEMLAPLKTDKPVTENPPQEMDVAQVLTPVESINTSVDTSVASKPKSVGELARESAVQYFGSNQEMISLYDDAEKKISSEIEIAINKKAKELGTNVNEGDKIVIENNVYKNHLKNNFGCTRERINELYGTSEEAISMGKIFTPEDEANATKHLRDELEENITYSIKNNNHME